MIKKDKDLLRAAKTMYRFQEDCKHRYFCTECAAYNGKNLQAESWKTGCTCRLGYNPGGIGEIGG